MNPKISAVAAAALSLFVTTSVSASSMGATTTAAAKPAISGSTKMSSGKMVAYCAKCKMYYTTTAAKKMHMKDAMGHKLAMMPMSKVPKDAKMGTPGSSTM